MMNWLEVVVLALLQGLTEFLPISSSAHLILVPVLLGWEDQGLAFDVAVHVGTLSAMLIYFRKELQALCMAWVQTESPHTVGARRLGLWLVLATVPILIVGALLHDTVSTLWRSAELIAWATLGFGLLLWWADRAGARSRTMNQLQWSDALWVGLSQCLALAPGVSRAGIVMTAGLLLGLQRVAAARVAFLLAVPTIAAAGTLSGYELWRHPQAADGLALLLGAGIAGLAAWLCIHFFLHLIERIGMAPFALYRVALGVALLVLL